MTMSATKTLAICAALLVGGALVVILIFNTEPQAERVTATRKSAMLVDVQPVERGDFRPSIVALGTVRPSREMRLSPRVSGEVVERVDAFTPGERVTQGQLLLRIDPTDYRNALAERQGELAEAKSALALELGRQEVARKDFELLGDEMQGMDRSLVLREPQLDAARAAVEAAEAAVQQARLDLERTTLRAPFDALVLSRDVDLGSQVATNEALGHLVDIDHYWVEATVPLAQLRWIHFPDEGERRGATVHIRNDAAWPPGVTREGRVHRLVGALDEETRLARILVELPDPLGDGPASDQRPSLMIGSFVELRIEGRELPGVVRLPRDLLRQGDTAWVMADGQLEIRQLDVATTDREHAYVRSGLDGDDLVVSTNLSRVSEGAELRRVGADSASADSTATGSRAGEGR